MNKTYRGALSAVVIIAVLLGLNALMNYLEGHREFHAAYPIRIIILIGVAIIAAVSLNLVNGLTGQFSIGHAGFFGIGAYAAAALTIYGQAFLFGHILASDESIPWLKGGAVLILSMLFGGTMAAIAGLLVGLPSLKLRGDYLAIVTLGFNQIIVVLIENVKSLGGSQGLQTLESHGQTVGIPGLTSFFWVYLVAAAVIAVSINLRRSVHGLAFESVREDEIAAEAMGVPTTKIKVTAFVLAAFIAGVAGALDVHYETNIAPQTITFIYSINYVVMVVLGGLGSVTGATLGAIIMTVLPEALRLRDDHYRLVIYSMILIVLMLARPQGLLGRLELDQLFRRKPNVAPVQ